MPQASKSKKCTKCSLEFTSKYNFCTECGQALKKINNCPVCDVLVGKTSKFCPECGTSISTGLNYQETTNSSIESRPSDKAVADDSNSIKQGFGRERRFLIGFGLFVGIVFLVVLLNNSTKSGSGQNQIDNNPEQEEYYPICAQIPRGFYANNGQIFVRTEGWDWGRSDGKVGYCVLPNSNEVIYSNIGSIN